MTLALTRPLPAPTGRFAVTLRLAARNLRSGLRGFGIFLACIALGVAAITGVGSVARALGDGLASKGRVILGGDLAVNRMSREATPEERTYLASRGTLSSVATVRAMARGANASALVEMKAVDASYPTIGAVELAPALPLAEALALQDGAYGAVADEALFTRLAVKPGDRIAIGAATFRLSAVLVSEPDKLTSGVAFGPRLLTSQQGLIATGLIQPGSLVRFTYRLTLPDGANDAGVLERFPKDLDAALPESGFEVRSRNNASPQFQRNIERFSQFLTLVGLTALIVGGVGVANAVTAYVERRRATLATLKSLGATGGRVFAIALLEVMALALLGVLIGLAIGVLLPFVLAWSFGAVLPIPLEPHIYPRELALGALYGLLTALAFALWPLGRTHDVPVQALFRDQVAPERRWPRRRYLVFTLLAAAALAATAILFAYDRRIATGVVAGVLAAFLLLRLMALAIMDLAARLPRPGRTELRLAIANIHRPGALTPTLVLSLGLGVALLVALNLIDGNIRAQLTRSLPERAPSFFFVDVPNGEVERFDAFLRQEAPDGTANRVPLMRGRIMAVRDVRASEVRAAENAAWVLDGDRGITYAVKPPEGSSVVEGQWWPADYQGPPLVSFDKEIADGIGLKLGDDVTVNVLGRNITAKVANLRKVEWQSLGINFVMVFSPNTFAGAPHTQLATLSFKGGADAPRDARILSAAARAFPSVTSVRVKDALDAINDVVEKLALAIRGASAVALVASILVLAGAFAAGQRSRLYDAVVLKTLGATRGRLLAAFGLEYAILGAVTAVFGAIAGTLAAWAIVSGVMKLSFEWQILTAFGSALIAVVVTIVIGLVGTWRILGQKPASYLRDL
jgi:putative ABC transport system permease protein